MTGQTGTTKESSFQTKAEKLIQSMGGYVLKTHVSSYQKQGEPDITCCYNGRYVSFELKKVGGKPSKLQLYRIKQIQNAGGIAIVTDSLDTIKEILYEIPRVQQGGEPER